MQSARNRGRNKALGSKPIAMRPSPCAAPDDAVATGAAVEAHFQFLRLVPAVEKFEKDRATCWGACSTARARPARGGYYDPPAAAGDRIGSSDG